VRALVAALVAGLALAAPTLALASEQHPSQGEMEADLVCPECHTPLDESDSPIAQQMKAQIRKWIAAGWTKSQIEDAFVAQLGPSVLGVPQTHGFDLLAWVLPFAGIAVGAVALGFGAWVWSRNRASETLSFARDGPALDPELERRVDEELARFDG
jgi:cytochrome c-type biogenesis protein CcmH